MAPLTNVEIEMEASSIITQVTREEDQITTVVQEKGIFHILLLFFNVFLYLGDL